MHDEAFTRNLSVSERYEEVQVLASESPERLEELRERFLQALSDLGGGAEEGRPAMVSEVAEGAGLEPEENPDDRALSERLAAELVDVGYASAEATIAPRLSPRNPIIGWLSFATGLSQGGLHSQRPPLPLRTTGSLFKCPAQGSPSRHR
jgi:hypothetical protein